jgi:hypothetical protein
MNRAKLGDQAQTLWSEFSGGRWHDTLSQKHLPKDNQYISIRFAPFTLRYSFSQSSLILHHSHHYINGLGTS